MAKNKDHTPSETGGVAKMFMIWIVNAYVFFMLAVYPLYYKDKYYDIDKAKWLFFRNVSAVFAVLVTVVFIWYTGCFLRKKQLKEFLQNAFKNVIVTDLFVIGYLIVCFISSLITPYKENVVWGVDGWYMGLAAQVSFVFIYFCVSRFWRWDSINLCIYLLSAFAVFFLGVIMRFRIDPMQMHTGLDDYYVGYFISTLGQVTWYSSYMCVMIPLGLVAYWCSKDHRQRIAFGIFIVMSFMTAVTQNAESAYVAMAGIFFMLFWISFESDEKLLRFFECVIMALGAFKLMGLLQKIFADRMVRLDAISIFMSQSVVTAVLLVLVVLIYLFLKSYVFKKTGFHIASYRIIRTAALILVAVGMIGLCFYIWLNSTGKLAKPYSSDIGYLVFNDNWGNNRGVSWRCTIQAFFKTDLIRKLFGVGPDNFVRYVYADYKDDFVKVLGEKIVQTCAHNEWLNTLINFGLLGLFTYLGIFISSFTGCMEGAKKYPYLYGVAIAVLAYILHNSFCYQQVICTPTIFILMGMARSVTRYGYKDVYESV